jgi:hypothetical protein
MSNFDQIKPLQDKIDVLLLDIKDVKPNLFREYTLIVDYSINGFIDLGAEYIKNNPQEFEIFLKKLNDIIKILTFIKTKENISEEEQKRDRCLRIADRKFDKPSAYKSGAVVRCRKGDIWKDLKEENLNTIYSDVLTQTEKEALKLVDKNWDKFGGEECNNGFCDIFAQKLSKYLPGSKIMSTEDNRSETFGHVWIEYKGKYFDAETPNGVSSWKELPWMIKFYNKNKEYPTDIEFLTEDESLHKWSKAGKAAPYGSGYSKIKDIIREIIQEESINKKIDELPQGKIFDDAKNIEGIFKKSSYSWSEVIELFEKNKHKGKPEIVDIKDIHITQPNIQANKVKNILDKVNNLSPINIVEFEDGEKIIYDGHHRLVANWALDNNIIKVNLVKVNNLKEDESLHKWFKRSGTPGKEGGWVDCNAPIRKDGKITGYKPCGRKEGEKRSKYPSCRPTATKCKDPGKGTKWGKTK